MHVECGCFSSLVCACNISSSIPPVQHYDDMLSIHSSTIGLHLSGDDQQQSTGELVTGNSASSAGDVVIVVNATTDNEEEAEMAAAHEGCPQSVVDIDTDADFLGDSPKRGYRSDSSGEKSNCQVYSF